MINRRFGPSRQENPAIVAEAACVLGALSQLSNSVFAANSTLGKNETRSLSAPARSTTWHHGDVEPKQKPIQPTEARMQVPSSQAGDDCRWK